MQPLATSSDAAARSLVAHDRSTPLYSSSSSNSRKRRVTISSSSTALPKSALASAPTDQQHPPPSPTSDATDDPAALALWRLARNARTPLQQRHLSDHLILHARDRRNGAAHAAHASSAHASASRSLALSPLVHDALLASNADRRRVSHSCDSFPPQRYAFVREWELPPLHATTSSSSASSKPPPQHRGGAAKHQVLHAVIAMDRVDGKLVVLTCLAKAIVTKWQIDHALRVMQTLARTVGFQALLRVWDADKNWVFVQAFDDAWTPVTARFGSSSSAGFSEDALRDVVFQVVALVHFLHAHDLSLAGELAPRDLMLKHGKVALLFHITYLLSGYTLVPANDRNKADDIAAIGMLMVQLCMAPLAPSDHAMRLDIGSVEDAIEDQLSHVSAQCRDTLFDCLTAKLTIDELSKRKWLRHVDFISVASKLEPCANTTHLRRLLYNSLMWKLAAFFLADWLDTMQCLAAIQTSSGVGSAEDEEIRQRLRQQKPNKRVLVGRKLLLLTGHSPHWLKRGAAIIPPLGSTILPHRESDSESDERRESTPLDAVFQSWTRDEVIPISSSGSGSGYSAFAYDFPSLSSSSSSLYEPLYDTFDWIEATTDVLDDDDDTVDDIVASPRTGRSSVVDDRTRALSLERKVSMRLLHEHTAPHEFQHETLRSLQTDHRVSSHSTSASAKTQPAAPLVSSSYSLDAQVPFAPETATDPLFFSAFGPHDVARRESFRVDIWAYLRQQRAEMLETAREQNECEVAQHVEPFHIQRGTLITVVMEANDRYGVFGDDSKTFRWRGDVSGVSFELYRKHPSQHRRSSGWTSSRTADAPLENGGDASDDDDDDDDTSELCIARIIAGTKVSLLYIRLHHTRPSSTSSSARDPSTAFALLESTLEHVRADVQEIPSQELEIIRPVGSGAFGDALLAKWHNTTDVVVKMLHRDMYRNSDAVAEFQHEAAVMHMLGKHPHVVELLGVCSNLASADDASFSLVTEYLPNGSLQDVLHGSSPLDHRSSDDFALLYSSAKASSASPLPLTFGLFSRTVMARDAAHGLANIHQGHFLHRDIAARNCLVDDHFRVKVCDFGLSRKLHPSGFLFDDDRHGFGPLKWMAPESILPPHLFSMHSDSYMFGVLLYEIFTGEAPFPALSTREAIALIREGKHVPIPTGLPHTHEQLMRRCFELHPLHRPTMDQIYATLDAWILHDTKTHVVAPGVG